MPNMIQRPLQIMLLEIRRLKEDRRAQDLIEYALLAGAVVVVVAGTLPSTLMPSIGHIWGRVREVMFTLTGS